MTTIPSNSTEQYGLWHPNAEGTRNGRVAGRELMSATAEQVAALSAKVEAGKAEALTMLGENQHVCERAIGAYHAAFFAELETWVARAKAKASV